jgi:antitoxin (DNA-binding transcriptional repressor) of toxin-antitoxin stability system
MKNTITATELARNLSRVLDQLVTEGGEVVIERNSRRVACLTAAPVQQTALEAMADIYRTLPEDAAAGWEADSRRYNPKSATLDKGMRDPWVS